MSNFLLEHLPGCTPFNPCGNCQVAAFIRSKLSNEDLAFLAEKLGLPPPSAERVDPQLAELLAKPIDFLEMLVRTSNCLKADNIYYIGQLVKKTEAELVKTPNLGRKCINEIKESLASKGLKLAG